MTGKWEGFVTFGALVILLVVLWKKLNIPGSNLFSFPLYNQAAVNPQAVTSPNSLNNTAPRATGVVTTDPGTPSSNTPQTVSTSGISAGSLLFMNAGVENTISGTKPNFTMQSARGLSSVAGTIKRYN